MSIVMSMSFETMVSVRSLNSSNVAQFWSWQLSFQSYEIGLGSAVSVLMLLVVVIIAAVYVTSTRSERVA